METSFNEDGLKQDGDWLSYSLRITGGFMRYRVLEAKAAITKSRVSGKRRRHAYDSVHNRVRD